MKTFPIIMTCLCMYSNLQAQQPTNKTTPKAASESSAEDCNSNKRNQKDNFGEDISSYGPNDIVYVYDFNKDPSKRRFYKITRNGNTLETNPVNFNREVIHHRDNVKFKIYHLNKFIYHASIADTVVTFDSEANVLFANFFQGEGDFMESLMNTFSSALMNKAVDKENFVQKNEFASTDDPESNKIQIDSLFAKIQTFVEDYNSLQEDILQAYNPCHSFDCCNYEKDQYTRLANLLSEIRIETAEIQRELNEKKAFTAPCIEAGNILKNQKDKIKDLTLKSLQITTKTQLLDKEKSALNEKINLSRGQEKKKQEANLAQIKEELLTKQNELKTIENESQEAKKELELLEEKAKDACDEDTEIAKKHLKELTAINSILEHLPTEEDLGKMFVFLWNMVEENNSYTTDYISLNGNELDLTINIASNDSVTKYFSIPEYNNPPIHIQIPIIGKPFVSFSSGSFLAPGKNLRNDTYSWQETVNAGNNTADTNFQLVNSGSTLAPLGLCALGNVEWKFTRNLGAGLSAGVGMTIEKNPRLAYLGGISFFFGDMRQFALTGGVTAMQVNKLASNFQTTADNQVIYHAKTDIAYYQELKVGGFVSLTYTPFKAYKPKREKQSKE